MRRKLILVLFLGLVVLGCIQSTKADTVRGFDPFIHSDTLTSKTLPYRLYLPPDYDPNEEYPCVLFLHGMGERGTWNQAQINGNVDNLLAHLTLPEYQCIILAPQCPVTDTWASGEEKIGDSMRMTFDVLDELADQLSIDTDRRYVTGLSMGGQGTWDAISRRPGYFAAAAPICGSGTVEWADRLVDTPIWAFHGEYDTSIPVSGSRDMIDAIRAAGGTPRYTEYAGAGHHVWDPAYATDELYEWMFAQAVPEPSTIIMIFFGVTLLMAHRVHARKNRI